MRLDEGQLLQVNPNLLEFALEHYFSLFQAIEAILNDDEISSGSKHTLAQDYWEEITANGGQKYLQPFLNSNKKAIIFQKVELKNILSVAKDPILSKKINQQQFEIILSELPEKMQKINFGFYIHRNGQDVGFYNSEERNGDHHCIYIGFRDMYNPGTVSGIRSTIRHELQHFTQDFYSRVLGSDKWIGLPSKKLIKGKDIFGDKDTKHQDVPVEMSTDLQDEIDYFLNDLMKTAIVRGKLNNNLLKLLILVFVGAKPGPSSGFFKHYLDTNKKAWQWAVRKAFVGSRKRIK